MAKDYYAILGVPRDAADRDVRRAYRRLARKYHPDVNPGSKDAEARFKEINEAYEVLSNPQKRAKYDQFGENWKYAGRMASGAGPSERGPFTRTHRSGRAGGRASAFDLGDLGLDDVFQEFLGDRRGPAATAEVTTGISLEEAYRGTTRVVEVPPGPGGGPPRRLEVRIPPGVDTGSRVHVADGDGLSDLFLSVRVQPHARFLRKGADLHTDVQVPVEDAVLGTEVEVPTLKGRILLKVPPETQNGRVFHLTGRGMPRLHGGGFGDLYVTVKVQLPAPLSERQRELFRELRRMRGVAQG